MPDFKNHSVSYEISPRALEKWNTGIKAATDDPDTTIYILDQIGYDWWTGEGTTARRISAALKAIGEQDITVVINSPGGDLFEGISIYNLLKQHPAKVTVKIIGMAASAASVIAMAGDERLIAKTAFYMIHNCWLMAIGNRNELREVADTMEKFDSQMASLYADTTGQPLDNIVTMLDAETWLTSAESLDLSFATGFIPETDIQQTDNNQTSAFKRLDIALAKAGMTRNERKHLFKELKTSMPSATGGSRSSTTTTDTPSAIAPQLAELLKTAQETLTIVKGGDNA